MPAAGHSVSTWADRSGQRGVLPLTPGPSSACPDVHYFARTDYSPAGVELARSSAALRAYGSARFRPR
jgi:hypothetical protein